MARIYEENDLLRTELPEATSSHDGSGSKIGRRYIEFSWCALPVSVTSCLESGFLTGGMCAFGRVPQLAMSMRL